MGWLAVFVCGFVCVYVIFWGERATGAFELQLSFQEMLLLFKRVKNEGRWIRKNGYDERQLNVRQLRRVEGTDDELRRTQEVKRYNLCSVRRREERGREEEMRKRIRGREKGKGSK